MAEFKDELIDVKFDLKDSHAEYPLNNLSEWTKCYVRIEPIECFPCYLKISFYRATDSNRDAAFSTLRLNIPGVEVGSVAFRKKSFTYGLCWKNNRKRCRLFMAFADKKICKMHMDCVEKSIDALEKYRKDTIQKCRLSKQNPNGKIPFEVDNIEFDGVCLPFEMGATANDISIYHQLSLRRASGCSGIYEEISISPDSVKRNQEPRGSIVSAIYVDMTNPGVRTEEPPPLPPRRPTHIYTAMHSPVANGALKHQKSSWNIKHVFGRGKSDKYAAKVALPKSQTSDIIGAQISADFQSNTLANCRSSFSTPDLTNMDIPKTNNITPKEDVDEVDGGDLDVMDIERSNSLNTSTNQFNRLPPINVSSNLLWSHNLSMPMSASTCDSSAINLVGANVNSINTTSGFEMTGYCRMTPAKQEDRPLVRSSTVQSPLHNDIILDDTYCTMAPLLPKTEAKLNAKRNYADLTRNITFERHFEFDEEIPPLDYSLASDAHNKSLHEESFSLSSDEGIASSVSTTTKSLSADRASFNSMINSEHISADFGSNQPDDASPYYVHAPKFDEKLPSYFPNTSPMPANEPHTKYIVNRKHSRMLPKLRRKKSSDREHNASANYSQLPGKISNGHVVNGSCKMHTLKQRRNSSDNIENQMSCCMDEKCYGIYSRRDSRSLTPLHMHNNALHSSAATAVKYDSQRHISRYNSKYNLEKHAKINKAASPLRIYKKCATFAIRLRSPPSSPMHIASATDTETDSEYGFSRGSEYSVHNRSFDSSMSAASKIGADYQMSSSSESSSSAIFRSFARFRRIDFSPLKTKINNILQRNNGDV